MSEDSLNLSVAKIIKQNLIRLSGLSSLVCMGKQVFAKRYVGISPLSAKK